LASRYQPVESLEMRRRCFGRTAGLDVGVLGGVGVVNVFGVGEKEDCEGLGCECGLLGFLSVMVRVAAGRPVRMRDVVFIFGGWVACDVGGGGFEFGRLVCMDMGLNSIDKQQKRWSFRFRLLQNSNVERWG
jgi:hypothetical protein